MRTEIRQVAVIGAGTIGASWAAYFLSRGLRVRASDPSPGAPDLMRRMIAEAWPILMRLGGKADADPEAWTFLADPAEAATGCDFVQENAPERLAIKQDLLARIDAALPPDVVIASSTSGLLASRLSEGCAHPGRVVIGHPFNPPHLIPLVEVVGGARGSPEAVAAAIGFYRAIGKHPIEIRKEVPGHLANRLQAAIWREAVHLVAEGVASVADVDAAITEGHLPPGRRGRGDGAFPPSPAARAGILVAGSRPRDGRERTRPARPGAGRRRGDGRRHDGGARPPPRRRPGAAARGAPPIGRTTPPRARPRWRRRWRNRPRRRR